MTYIQDLTPCTYHRMRINPHIAIGWLDMSQPFTTGHTTDEFRQKLEYLTERKSVMHYRGWHECQWCPRPSENRLGPSGNGSIVVKSPVTGKTYEAPVLIKHYVAVHNYLPPEDFIIAVLAEDV